MIFMLTGSFALGCSNKTNNSDDAKIQSDPNKESLISFLSFDSDDDLYKVRNSVNKSISYEIENFRNDVASNIFYQDPSPAYRFESTVSGKALAFDGYSNYIALDNLFNNLNEFSINLWVGLRTYEIYQSDRNITPFLEIYDSFADEGLIFGFTHFGKWGIRFKTALGWQEIWVEDNLDLYSWHNLSLSYGNGEISLFKNGECLKKETVGKINISRSSKAYLGRNTYAQTAKGYFPNNYLGGCMDEIRIYNKKISDVDVTKIYQSYLKNDAHPPLSFKEMNFPSNYLNDNVYRTTWHGHPSMNWVSDTNGGFYYKGNYHLFFTKSDLGPELGSETWGHIVSPDMVHWHEVQPAIRCEDSDYDNRYVYAGSGAVINNIPYIFYTGFVLANSGLLYATISMATPSDLNDPDLEQWDKIKTVRLTLPSGFKADEFRDPQIYIENDTAFLIVVSRRDNGNPVILGFSASINDITNWSYRGVVFEVNYSQYKYSGYMWEVPIFLRLTNPSGTIVKYLFAEAPINDVGLSNDSIYFLGDFNAQTCRYTVSDLNARRYDFGSDYFSCSGGEIFDPVGNRTVLFETLQCCWNLSPLGRYQSGYSAGFNMGRYYSLDDNGELVVNHIDYSSIYGKELLKINSLKASDAEQNYEVGRSYHLEYKMKLNDENRRAGFEILSSKSATEALSFYYDVNRSRFVFDEMKTSNPLSKKTSYMDYVIDKNKEIDIEIFVDHSCVEIYIDNCCAMSGRAYNQISSEYIKVIGTNWTISDLICQEMNEVY